MVDLQLDITDHMGVGKTDWQCESGNGIPVYAKGAVLIESVLPFVVELGAYAEHGGAGGRGLVEEHLMVEAEDEGDQWLTFSYLLAKT